MMYKDLYHPKIKKDLKKIDLPIKKKIQDEHIPIILSEPTIGEELVGDLQGVHSYHFKEAGQQFRIAYIVDEEEQTIYIQMIAKRGDFYTLLKKRV